MLSKDFFVVAVELGIVSFLSSIELLAVGSIGRGALKRFLDYSTESFTCLQGRFLVPAPIPH